MCCDFYLQRYITRCQIPWKPIATQKKIFYAVCLVAACLCLDYNVKCVQHGAEGENSGSPKVASVDAENFEDRTCLSHALSSITPRCHALDHECLGANHWHASCHIIQVRAPSTFKTAQDTQLIRKSMACIYALHPYNPYSKAMHCIHAQNTALPERH